MNAQLVILISSSIIQRRYADELNKGT